ncbi:uncharacterized protein ACA1_374300 [Acanthamoeba castellanii str. Neff]|uniref:Uncharacterized protein n=1 Tax=Acanthamoeba castellanii (strain ATCC 30010 / Neff) TaxID=1257118 RepID=L8GH86_ACACF|nr:uncharacterized protein ACA1_374300 [Acanthamoeba castellanii str. Neff]ELR12362.1 hypothetical protein ACA1_374300 [Acanthamoeba castellanii str. Neff]
MKKTTMAFSAVALLFVLLSCCSSFVLGGVPTTEVEQSVVIGFDPNFVDARAWNSENPSGTGEAVLVARFVESLAGESVIKIEDYTDKAAWRSALWNGKVVIFIETEESTASEMKAALSQDTRTAIKDWVRNNGGAVVFCYGESEPAQVLTGLDLTETSPGPTPSDEKRGEVEDIGPASRTSDGDASPLFGTNSSAPTEVSGIDACSPWYLGNELPARSASLKCMYGTIDECYLWRYADGKGAWYGVCPDFYDWGYGEDAQDGGWMAVMEIIIGSADPTQTSSGAQLTHWVQWLAALL